jgi:hypothetical protein
MHRIICLLFSTCLLCGCAATSKITAFRDPAFATKQFTAIVVFAHGMPDSVGFEFERQMCMDLAPTPCDPGKSVLPPTRQYSQYTVDEVKKYLKTSGADAILVIARVADQSDTRYFGTIADLSSSASATASSSLNFYGNAALWGGAADGAVPMPVSVPEYSYTRVAFGQLGLFDLQSGTIAWLGKILVGGQSRGSITPEAFMYSATSKIVRELRASKLVD